MTVLSQAMTTTQFISTLTNSVNPFNRAIKS